MLNRRTFLVAGTLLPALSPIGLKSAAALPVPPGDKLAFRIMRKGDRIGTHALSFSRAGDDLTVDVDVEILVKLGPFPVFRYNHKNQEKWQGGKLLGFDSKTNDDGDAAFGRMAREAKAFAVDGSKSGRYEAPLSALAATHWNKAELDAPMVNPQNGELLKLTVVPKGVSEVALASGGKVKANHFALEGDQPLELWYDDQGVWTHLLFKGKDGSAITYEKL